MRHKDRLKKKVRSKKRINLEVKYAQRPAAVTKDKMAKMYRCYLPKLLLNTAFRNIPALNT